MLKTMKESLFPNGGYDTTSMSSESSRILSEQKKKLERHYDLQELTKLQQRQKYNAERTSLLGGEIQYDKYTDALESKMDDGQRDIDNYF